MKRFFLLLTIPFIWIGYRQIAELGLSGSRTTISENKMNLQAFNGFTREEMLAEMKTTILNEEALEKEMDSTEVLPYYAENISLKVELLIKNKLIRKIRNKNIASIYRTWNIFSRCPSGYNAVVIADQGAPTAYGWMLVSKGCRTLPISKFKYDIKNNSIEAMVSDKVGYIPLDEFIILYKMANLELKKTS
jgi:hypothetical protein